MADAKITLTALEAQHLLVLCRAHRDTVQQRKMELEEKHRLGWDGPTSEAILVCENELHLLNGIVAKLWRFEINNFDI